MPTKVSPPQLSEETRESFDRFVLQFDRFLRVSRTEETDKLDLLLLSVGGRVAGFYDEIEWPSLTTEQISSGETEYLRAVNFFKNKLSGDKNVLSERVRLYTYRQENGQSLNDYLSALRSIAKYCNFPSNFADEAIRDAFCVGLNDANLKKVVYREFSSFSRQGKKYTLSDAIATAEIEVNSKIEESQNLSVKTEVVAPLRVNSPNLRTCFWCGSKELHGRQQCPARGKKCTNCNIEGHFSKMCNRKDNKVSSIPVINAVKNKVFCRRFLKSVVKGKEINWLVDSGSDLTLLSKSLADTLSLGKLSPCKIYAKSAKGDTIKIIGKTNITIELSNCYVNVCVHIVKYLCDSAILGINALSQFKSLQIDFDGTLPALKIASTSSLQEKISEIADKPSVLDIDPVALFSKIPSDRPIRSPSRYCTRENREFIKAEVNKLLKEKIIVPSSSSWRSQAFVTKAPSGKRRMVIDFSSTINRATELDAYPVPLITNVLRDLEGSRFFSRIDLRSAYHQVPLKKDHQHFTAFEADGQLFEFTRLPFGVTNGVPIFCRIMSQVLSELPGVVHYFDDVVIHGKTQEDHDVNLKHFLNRAAKIGLTLNSRKCTFNSTSLLFLGHYFKDGTISPDPNRMSPLENFPTPTNTKSLERLIGLFVYYSKWIKNFAEKAAPLFEAKSAGDFPLKPNVIESINILKNDIKKSSLSVPIEGKVLTLETDASLLSIGASLNQDGRPVAFFSHKLNPAESKWSIVELEAYAIVKAIEHFRPFLIGKKFELLTDQKSVAFLLDSRPKNRIKNAKINRWRLIIAEYSFEIRYRAGVENHAADAFSRISSIANSLSDEDLVKTTHENMGHPGFSRLEKFLSSHFSTKNLKSQISKCIKNCQICAQQKPRFPSPPKTTLISSSRPWQRLSIDFMGPKHSSTTNKYIFTVIDEYTRFPFAFAVAGPTTRTATDCLLSLFTLFGPPESIHSDRGTAFESIDFHSFLNSWNILKSRTTPYHPQGNGQVERMNGTLWKTLQLRLLQNKKAPNEWESELPFALSNIRLFPSRSLSYKSPHDAFFQFSRRSTLDDIPMKKDKIKHFVQPDWLKEGNIVLFKKHNDEKLMPVRVNKILSPYHLQVTFPQNGRMDTISSRFVSRCPNQQILNNFEISSKASPFPLSQHTKDNPTDVLPEDATNVESGPVFSQQDENSSDAPLLARKRQAPGYLKDFEVYQ